MGKKAENTTGVSKDAKETYRISDAAITKSTGLDSDKAIVVAERIYSDENNYWDVVVVTLDIRKSSLALVNVEDFPCKDDCEVREENGWFDKFTGDGVIVFWRLPMEPYTDKPYYILDKDTEYDEKLKLYNQKWNEAIRVAIEFSIEVTKEFLEVALTDIRKTCGLLPIDFGISVGIDAGNCLLTELEASDNFPKRYKKYEEKYEKMLPVSPAVTAIGRAIIGANRMVSSAKPYDIIVNSYPGSNLKEAMEDSKEEVGRGAKFSLERTTVCTKEYNPVEAYRVVSGHLEHLKRTKTFCDRVKKIREEKAKETSKQEDIREETKDAESREIANDR